MSILFKPNGTLNLATDPSDLPQDGDKFNIISEAMSRCKNLRLDLKGVVKTRDGSKKINSTALGQTGIRRIIEQAGDRYTFAGTVIYKNESSIDTGLTDADWSGILYNSYNATTENIFALNGTDRKRIEGSNVYEWGIAAPTVVPTVANGGGSGLTGDYNAKYTYCRKEGTTVVCESDPSGPAVAAETLADDELRVTWTASSDSQVTHVRIYRTLSDGTTYYHDKDIAIGTTTVDTNTTDGSLGSEVATNHDRPPLGSFVAGPTYNGTCFIIKDNLLYYCLPKQPEYWPQTYYIEVSPPQFPGKCVVFYNGQPYYLTKNKIYYIQGSGHNTFFPMEMDSITGALNMDAAVAVHGHGIYHVGSDGIYLWSDTDRKVTPDFEPIFRGETVNGVPGIDSLATCWLVQWRDKLYFGYTDADHTYPSNIMVFNLTNKRVSYYDFGLEIRGPCIDEENNRLLFGDNSGFVWHVEDTDQTDDGGTAISWEIESKEFSLPTRRHFPRWVKYDVDASDSDSATGEVILDGTSHQSHTLTSDRDTKRRLITTGNGKRAAIRLSGTGTVEIYTVEAE